MRKRLLVLLLCALSFSVYSQDFSNKGKDFWVGYGYHTVMTQNNGQNMVLYFATDQVTTVTVSIPGIGYSETYANIPANTVFTSNPIPKIQGGQDARLMSELSTPQNKGIHIVSDKAIVAYAHIYNAAVSGATILFPTNTLGKEYYSINYKNVSNSANANSWFYVIACDTGTTTVEIIPSANTLTRAAGVPFTVTLSQGEIYNFMGALTNNTNPYTGVDLTGSRIRSIATAGNTCKRIAVYSGSGRISITCNASSSSSDNYMAQAFPKSAWGKKFLTVNTGGLVNNIYRICVSDPAAAVMVNGSPVSVPLVNSFYYEIPATSAPLKIESNLPITVAQYITSQAACGNGSPGDPEVIYLSPVEQNISKVIWNATPNFAITSHYYSVVIPNTGTAISSFKLDGVTVNPALFTVHPQDPGYSYLTQNVGPLQRRIESDSGFNAIAYGFGSAESYGYNAGTNVRDLYQRVGVTSLYSIEPAPSVCTGSPFKFKVSLPYLPDSIKWILAGLPGAPANVVRTYSSPAVPADADSSTVLNGKTVYWYSIPNFYNFNTVGIYPVSIIVYAANAEGCGNEQIIDFDLEITDPPVAEINWVHNGCINQAVQFNDQSTTVKPTYKWWWDFGDPSTGANNFSTLKNPTHNFSAPGTYSIRFAAITTPGCLSDTITRQIVIHPLAAGNISGPALVCQNDGSAAVIFTGTAGTAPFTFNYNINNGPPQVIVSTSGNSVALPIPTTNLGTFAYHLVSVKDAAGTGGCIQNQPDTVSVLVRPAPSATIGGTTTVCQNAAGAPVTFTASNTLAPYTFTYTLNGGAPQTITTVTGNGIVIPAPTATAGTFIYSLVSVSDGNATPCVQPQSGIVTVTVNPLPTASISGTAAVCQGAPAPVVTFTGAGGTAPYSFTYSLNGAPDQTITGTGNIATIPVPTGTTGTFTYTLKNVRDAANVSCNQPQTGTATVTVNPPPTANFNVALPTCINSLVNFNDISMPNAGVLNNWSWNFGDPASGTGNTSAVQNPTHVYANTGTYTVTLSVTNDRGCPSAIFSKTVTVGTLPEAGFILPEVCLLDPFAQFTDTSKAISPATINAWKWNFGDPASGSNNSSTVRNAQHTYPAVGNYNVQLIAYTDAGCTDTLTQLLTVNGGNPQAAFIQLNPTSSCSSDTVAIQNKSTIASGIITKLEIYWDNAAEPSVFETDEIPVFDKIYKHKYPTLNVTRTYTIRYRAYSGGVCVNDRLQTVTVLATPDVTISTIPNQCYSSTPVALTYGSQNGAVLGTETYTGPGVVFAGGWQFIPSLAGIGTHTIHYKFTSSAGACSDSISTTITVPDTATASFTISLPACERTALSFTETSRAPAGVSLSGTTWDFGDGTPPENHGVGGTVSHVYANPGTYTVTMFNTSAAGCRSILFSRQVVVGPIPKPGFSFPPSLCLPAASVIFTDLSTIADGTESSFSYLWNFGDPASGIANTATTKDPVHIYTGAGPYSVNLRVTSGAGCFNDTTIIVNSIHPQPKANFDFSTPAICLADNASFTDRSTGGDGVITGWNWTFGDGNSSALQNPTHLYNTAATFNVQLYITNSFGCNSDTATRPFTVYPYPLVEAGPDKFVLEGGSIPLTTTFTGEDLSWLWEPATYLNSNTAAVPLTTPLQDIIYTVTVSNPGGCSASDTVSVKILAGPKIPNTFSPNGDGINEKWIIEYLDTYPDCRVKVFTRQGQLVFESRGYRIPWNGTIKGKALPIDTYYYIIEPENGRKPITGFVTIVK